MNTIRTLAALGFATLACVAQASEITNFAVEPSLRSRADVRAEARSAVRSSGELYDGRQFETKTPASMNNEAARRDTMAAQRVAMPRAGDYVGG